MKTQLYCIAAGKVGPRDAPEDKVMLTCCTEAGLLAVKGNVEGGKWEGVR